MCKEIAFEVHYAFLCEYKLQFVHDLIIPVQNFCKNREHKVCR